MPFTRVFVAVVITTPFAVALLRSDRLRRARCLALLRPQRRPVGFLPARDARLWVGGIAILVMHYCGSARAEDPTPRGAVLPVLTISKSSNKNVVQYAIRVDADCEPVGSRPLFAYWRMLEQGPAATAPLLERELPAYGVGTEQVLPAGSDAGQVRITLRAVPDRAIVVETVRQPGGCLALATTTIGGARAHLFDVYVRLHWLLGIKYLLLEGWSIDGKTILREKLSR